MIKRKSSFRQFMPSNSINHLTNIHDLVGFEYTCFHCGGQCYLVNNVISDHDSKKGKCWASGRNNPSTKPPRDPNYIQVRIRRQKNISSND